MNSVQISQVMGLLSDPHRLRIIGTLNSKGELCVTEVARNLGSTISAVSHQLRKLEFLGIVTKCRQGREICYCLNRKNNLTGKILKILKYFQSN